MKEPFDLTRFEEAHRRDFATALAEIQSGRKRSHWMWYIFPQLRGLGRSYTAEYFGIPDLDAAKAFLTHPILGQNLFTITRALLKLPETNPTLVMGVPDDLKLRSCMTLFEAATPEHPEFAAILEKFYGGKRDPLTLELLAKEQS